MHIYQLEWKSSLYSGQHWGTEYKRTEQTDVHDKIRGQYDKNESMRKKRREERDGERERERFIKRIGIVILSLLKNYKIL